MSLHTKEGDLHRPPNVVKRWPVPRTSISRAAFRAALDAREAALKEAAETEGEAAEEQLGEAAEEVQGRASLVLSQYLVARTAFFLRAGQALRRQARRGQTAGAPEASAPLGVRRKLRKGAGRGRSSLWVGSGRSGKLTKGRVGQDEGKTLGVVQEEDANEEGQGKEEEEEARNGESRVRSERGTAEENGERAGSRVAKKVW